MSAEESDYRGEFEQAFRGAVQYALDTGFSDILELKPVQEEALDHFIKREDVFAVLPTGCGKSLIFQRNLYRKSVHICTIKVLAFPKRRS